MITLTKRKSEWGAGKLYACIREEGIDGDGVFSTPYNAVRTYDAPPRRVHSTRTSNPGDVKLGESVAHY